MNKMVKNQRKMGENWREKGNSPKPKESGLVTLIKIIASCIAFFILYFFFVISILLNLIALDPTDALTRFGREVMAFFWVCLIWIVGYFLVRSGRMKPINLSLKLFKRKSKNLAS